MFLRLLDQDLPEVFAMSNSHILWPPGYEPANCPVHVQNHILLNVSSEVLWAWLVRALLWPTWYRNSSNVRILTGQSKDLSLNTRFRWKTFGLTIESTVLEFVPFTRIAWDAHAPGFDGYHAWLLLATNEGTYVRTEETQKGFFAMIQKLFAPNRMSRFHQLWLERLGDTAKIGLPP